MKLDWELFNDILKRVEELPAGDSLHLDDPLEVEHALLLHDAGMIELLDVSSHGGKAVIIERLTIRGHNYLSHIQNQTVYNKVKNFIKNQGGNVAFDILVEIAKTAAFNLLK